MEITREQFQNMVSKAPSGLEPAEIAQSLMRQGHTLQGLDTTQMPQAPGSMAQPMQTARPQINVGQAPEKQGGFWSTMTKGVRGFGESIAGAIQPFTPTTKRLEQTTQSLFDTQTQILQQIQQRKSEGGDTTTLMKALEANAQAIQEIPGAEELNPALTKSTKQILGEAVETGAMALSGGIFGSRLLSSSAALGATTMGGRAAQEDRNILGNAIAGGIFGVGGAKLGTYVANRLPKLLSIFTGESMDAVSAALRNPRAADAAIKQGDTALRNAVQEAGEHAIKLRDAFNQGHQQAFRQIASDNADVIIPQQQVTDSFLDLLRSKGVRVSGDTLDFSVSKIKANPGEVSKINSVWESIRNWDDFSVTGTNQLKQIVGSLAKFADDAGVMAKSPTLSSYYGKLVEQIKTALPANSRKAFEDINKKYSSNIDLYDDMVAAFNSGDPFTKMAGMFGKNKDSLRQTIQFFESQAGSPAVSPTVAGRELAMEKSAAFGFLNPRSWIDFFISPQLQGQVVTKTGATAQSLKKAGEFMTKPIK